MIGVGDKIVCINDKAIPNPLSPAGYCWDYSITKGQIYIVRECCYYLFGDAPCVRLVDVFRSHRESDAPFLMSRFRPVKTTDISIFIEIDINPYKDITAPEGPVREMEPALK